jgi:hypothetical protein
MKKMMMTLAAVLCCAMTMTVFTACGSDDDDSKNPAEDTTPKQVAMNFVLYNTADMLNYCNIEISYDNGLGNAKTVTLTKDMVNENFSWKQMLTADRLPATFTISRKVTLKQSIDEVEKFTYTRGYSYAYALYNAAGKRVFESTPYANTGSSDGSGAKIAERINAGALDHTYTFTFDAKGNMTSK